MNVFEVIPQEKGTRILNAALREFTDNGYTRASTNVIVAEAGIAKGLLFHYFKSKKQLYLSLYDYCIQVSLSELYERLDYTQRDVITRLRQIQAIKLELLTRHPDILNFIQSAYLEQDDSVKGDIKAQERTLVSENLAKIYSDLDYDCFRTDIEPARALQIIIWTMDGYTNDLLARARTADDGGINMTVASHELDTYLDTLRKSLYR